MPKKNGLFKSRRNLALTVLAALNLLNYVDRFIYSAVLPEIKKSLVLSDTQLGLLGSAFTVAYLLASPIAGMLADRVHRSRLMSLGALIWSCATALTGLSGSFVKQMFARIGVGAGESSFAVTAPSFLSDLYGPSERGRLFAVFSGAITVGSALGYVAGGVLAKWVGWRWAVFSVSVPGFLLAATIWKFHEPMRGALDSVERVLPKKISFQKSTRELAQNKTYAWTVLGYAAYTFVIGGLAFWMPSYIVRTFDVSLVKADTVFGGLTVVGGFIGTFVGGFTSDWWQYNSGNTYLRVSVFSALVSCPLLYFSFLAKGFYEFCAIFFVLEIVLFSCISPLDAAVMGVVRPEIRGMAMAWELFIIHLFGDGISRVIIGHISDTSNLQHAMLICPPVLMIAGGAWVYAWHSTIVARGDTPPTIHLAERQNKNM